MGPPSRILGALGSCGWEGVFGGLTGFKYSDAVTFLGFVF